MVGQLHYTRRDAYLRGYYPDQGQVLPAAAAERVTWILRAIGVMV